jgi:hypothetical protein
MSRAHPALSGLHGVPSVAPAATASIDDVDDGARPIDDDSFGDLLAPIHPTVAARDDREDAPTLPAGTSADASPSARIAANAAAIPQSSSPSFASRRMVDAPRPPLGGGSGGIADSEPRFRPPQDPMLAAASALAASAAAEARQRHNAAALPADVDEEREVRLLMRPTGTPLAQRTAPTAASSAPHPRPGTLSEPISLVASPSSSGAAAVAVPLCCSSCCSVHPVAALWIVRPGVANARRHG